MIELKQGDCLELMRDIPDGSVDMVLCDLPYGTSARNKWDSVINPDKLWEQYNRITKPNAAILLFGQDKFTAHMILSNIKNHRYNLIWQKTTPTGFLNANRMPLRCHEDIMVFYRSLPTYNPQKTSGHMRKVSKAAHKVNCVKTLDYGEHGLTTYDSTERFPTSVLKFATDKQKSALHPTQKPVALCEYLIRTYTNDGDVVLDNCMGSGTTGVAALHCGRSFIGYELDKQYFEIARNRIVKENIDG